MKKEEKRSVWLITSDTMDVSGTSGRYSWINRGQVIAVCNTKENALAFANDHIKNEIRVAENADDGYEVEKYTDDINTVNEWVTYMCVSNPEEGGKKYEYSLKISEWMVLGN